MLLQIVRNVVGSAALTSHDVCWAFSSQSLVLAAEYRTPRIAGRSSWSSHGRKHSGILSAEWSLCRIASTCYADNRTYGDNLRDQEQPATKTLLALSGAKAQRPRIAMGVLVLWAAFGYQLNWRKAQLTSTVNWIGAQITPWTTPSGRARLTVTIPEDKVSNILEAGEGLWAARPCVGKKQLRAFAGLVTWVAILCPQLSPYCRMLWAALSLQPLLDWVYFKQVEVPLEWLYYFLSKTNKAVYRHFVPFTKQINCVTFDASPTGGGGTIQFGLKHMNF